MENLRVVVNNAADQTEVRNIMISLGYPPKEITCISGGDLGFVVNAHNENGATYKEITLPELRDLVVLKRNDIEDATHEDYLGLKHLLLMHTRHVWGGEKWLISTADFSKLKPIEKTEMKAKEYLNKETHAYVKTHDLVSKDSNWIEIPDGAETLNYFDDKENLFFLKGSGKDTMFSNDLNDWEWKEWGDIDFDGVVCLWSRHTHPEELPFIDDECYTNKSDGGFRLPKVEPCDMSKWVEHRGESLNDQYAEIETVRKKIRENNHYFIDVSDVDEVDFYEIAKRYNVTDPAIQHILKKCLAIGNRGHKDLETDLMDILKTAKRALRINGFGEPK